MNINNVLFVDDCCLLPNQVQIQMFQQPTNRVALASPQLYQQSIPIQVIVALNFLLKVFIH